MERVLGGAARCIPGCLLLAVVLAYPVIRPATATADTIDPPWYDETSTLVIVVIVAALVVSGIATLTVVARRRRAAKEGSGSGSEDRMPGGSRIEGRRDDGRQTQTREEPRSRTEGVPGDDPASTDERH